MRLPYVTLVTLCALAVGAPARAQVLEKIGAPSPELVVARLMSFDLNHDGRIAAGELPERMQDLLARGDESRDGALDRAEVNRLASSPAQQIRFRSGLEPGQYGFGAPFGLDTKLKIKNALEDLRLAGDSRQKAFDVADSFLESADDIAEADLMSTMKLVLTADQLKEFRESRSGRAIEVSAVESGGVTFFGATAEEAHNLPVVTRVVRVAGVRDLEALLRRYPLDAGQRRVALEALHQYKVHADGGMNDAQRAVLREQLAGVLSEEQCDDLNAALDRPTLMKMPAVKTLTVSFDMTGLILER